MAVVPPASVLRLLTVTACVSVVVPVLFSAKACAPFTVPLKLIADAPAFTVVAPASVVVPPAVKPALLYVPESVVLSLNAVAPVVLTPTDDEVPGASVVSEASGAVPPTNPPNVVAPPVFTVSACGPFTVVAKSIAPLPELASAAGFGPIVTASL